MKESFERIVSEIGDQYLYLADEQRSRLLKRVEQANRKRLKWFLITTALIVMLVPPVFSLAIPYFSSVRTVISEKQKFSVIGQKENADVRAAHLLETGGKEVLHAIECTEGLQCNISTDYYLKEGERKETRIYLILDDAEQVIGMLQICPEERESSILLQGADSVSLKTIGDVLIRHPGEINVLVFRNGRPVYAVTEEGRKLIKV